MADLEGRVEDLTHDGCGVVKIEGKAYFIDGVLPNELIRFQSARKRKGKFQGKLDEIIEPSEQRVKAECEYFGVCGGCVLQHLNSAAQLKNKENILFENLSRIGKVSVQEHLPAIQGETFGYRRKARLGIKKVDKKGGILVGFRERNSSFITSLNQCKTLDTRISDLLPGLHDMISELSNNNRIPQIEVAAGDDDVALILRHLEPLVDNDLAILEQYAKDQQVQMYLQSGGPDTVTPLWPKNPKSLTYGLPSFDLNISFLATDFIQVNHEINNIMVSRAVEYLGLEEQDNVLDLFCGVGNFTLAIARSGANVVGIEGDRSLVDRANNNAKSNNLGNVKFEVSNLHVEDLKHIGASGQFNKLLIDPPRSGALEVVSQVVPRLKPEIMVYVSCNPATLARDADVMVNTHGYNLTQAGAMDMFPHTAHVESIAVFSRSR